MTEPSEVITGEERAVCRPASVLTGGEARKRGLGRGVKQTHPGSFDRLEHMLPTLNVAEADEGEFRVEIGGRTYAGPGFHMVDPPGWIQDEGEPFNATLNVVVRDAAGKLTAGREDGAASLSVAWLAFDEDDREHPMTGLDLKVDEEGQLYALARYGSLYARTKCITCNGVRICGANPSCPGSAEA